MLNSTPRADNNELDTDGEGNYKIQTNADGLATFSIGSENPTRFGLYAKWNGKQLADPADLVIASKPSKQNAALGPPAIASNPLPIPPQSAWPAPTFKVQIPRSGSVQPGGKVALLLNDRLVYNGLADPALGDGVDVAYAALNLTDPNTCTTW